MLASVSSSFLIFFIWYSTHSFFSDDVLLTEWQWNTHKQSNINWEICSFDNDWIVSRWDKWKYKEIQWHINLCLFNRHLLTFFANMITHDSLLSDEKSRACLLFHFSPNLQVISVNLTFILWPVSSMILSHKSLTLQI